MALHHAVLALLATKPAHGYELRSAFEQAVGEQWGGLNIGHVYQLLDRLSRDGLIESERQAQPIKPDRVVHRLTESGRAELDRWLSEPSVRARGYRDDFFLKLMAAEQGGDPATLAGVLSRQRAHLLKELHSLAEARSLTASSAIDSLLITAAVLHMRADLDLIDAAENSLCTESAVSSGWSSDRAPAADGAPTRSGETAVSGDLTRHLAAHAGPDAAMTAG